jgi:hypothetical protein
LWITLCCLYKIMELSSNWVVDKPVDSLWINCG